MILISYQKDQLSKYSILIRTLSGNNTLQTEPRSGIESEIIQNFRC